MTVTTSNTLRATPSAVSHGRRKGLQALTDLAEGQKHQQAEKRPNRRTPDGAQQDEHTQRIDARRAANEQPIRPRRVTQKKRIRACREREEAVADATLGKSAPCQ